MWYSTMIREQRRRFLDDEIHKHFVSQLDGDRWTAEQKQKLSFAEVLSYFSKEEQETIREEAEDKAKAKWNTQHAHKARVKVEE